MPVGFWDDPDGARYRAAYFDRFPGVWHHGDYAVLKPGRYVLCAVTGQKIPLDRLRYWSAELQEAYAGPAESLKRWQETR